MTFGNYVLFNLLVAILVEGFSTEVKQTKKYFEIFIFFYSGNFFRKVVVLRRVEVVQID
jgi:hypothetical protein